MTVTSDAVKEKRAKLAQLKEYHQATFDSLGIKTFKFYPKWAYTPAGKDELYIAFFENEINHGADIYTEFADRDYNLQNPDKRELYKLRYNPHYATEYERLPAATEGNNDRFLVPISELILVQSSAKQAEITFEEPELDDSALKVEQDFGLPNPSTDSPFSQMTIRDIAAILWKRPVSQKDWLNKLIKETK